MFMLFIGNLTILPIYMQIMLNWSSLGSGLILLLGGLVMGLLSPLTGKLFDKVGGRLLSVTVMMIIIIGSLFIAQFSADTSRFYAIISFSITMLGNSMIMTPITTQALNALPKEYISHGTAMNNTIRQISAAIGTGILVTLMSSLSVRLPIKGVEGSILDLGFTFYIIAIVAIVAFGGVIVAFFIEKMTKFNFNIQED